MNAVESLQASVTKKHVVIIGGGLQGTSTAYWLKQKGNVDVTIVERTGIAASASGKGGGFLARNWGRGATEELHEKSFDLLVDLAKSLPVKSFRQIPTLEVTGELSRGKKSSKKNSKFSKKRSHAHPDWLDATDVKANLLESAEGTAQVNPQELCQAFFDNSEANIVIGAVRGFEFLASAKDDSDSSNSMVVTGVKTDQGVISCDQVVVAAGVWSILLEDWLPNFRLPMDAICSTSLLYEDSTGKVNSNPNALFCAEDSNSCHLEVYPRNDGTVYLCGTGACEHVNADRLREGGDLDDATKTKANYKQVNAARRSFGALAPDFAQAEPLAANACMRPCAPDALPIIGKTSHAANVYIATGGNCWGILWSAITGHLISDLLLDKTPMIKDLSPFSPDRFMPKARNRGRAKGLAQLVGVQW